MKKNQASQINEPNKLFSYWKKEKISILFVFVSGIAYNAGLLFGPIYQGKLIDSLLEKKPLYDIIRLAIIFIALIAFVQACRYFKRFYVRRFANNTSASMRIILYNNLINKPQLELEKENFGSLMTKAISDVDACVEGMRKFTTELFDTGVFIVAYIIYMIACDLKLTVLSCLFIPVAMLIAEKLKRVIYKYTSVYKKKQGVISDITYEQIENVALYRLYGRDNHNKQMLDEKLSELEESAIYANIWENSMQPIYNVIAMTGVILVIWLGGNKAIAGEWTIGSFLAYLSIFTALAFKASKAAKLFNSVQKATVSWKRIKPYLNTTIEADYSSSKVAKNTELKIKNLSFEYIKGNKILNGISLEAKNNALIGITGPVACGKSTLGKIFLGEYKYQGEILINGYNLSEYNEYERSQMISYLGHNPNLMSDTIYNNIALGEDKDIADVLKIVCLDEDIKSMEAGVNTLVGNKGVRLSGGQQSRVALARALYHKTPILILDDPFSAVDIKTEQKIIENLQAYYTNQIILLISHRLNIFQKASNILLMHDDKTYEYGTHDSLMKSSPLYRELYMLQASGAGENNEK